MTQHATLPLWQHDGDAGKLEKLRHMVEDLYGLAHGPAVARVIAMMERHPAADAKEAADAQLIAQMCRAHPNILSQTCEAGHVTGSALIVHAPSQRVLLNHHKKFDRWMQFGGHAEHELDPGQVALREAREETGLPDLRIQGPDGAVPFDVDAHVIAARNGRPQHYHLDLRYLLLTNQPDAARATDESNEIRWFGRPEMQALGLEPGVVRMLDKAGRTLGWDA